MSPVRSVTPEFRNIACDGGADRIRTDDPLLAKQVLYQLSYDPGKGRTILKRTCSQNLLCAIDGTRFPAWFSSLDSFDHSRCKHRDSP